MATRKRKKTGARKKASGRRKKTVRKKTVKKKSAGKKTAKTKPARKGAAAPVELDPLRAVARSFAARGLREGRVPA